MVKSFYDPRNEFITLLDMVELYLIQNKFITWFQDLTFSVDIKRCLYRPNTERICDRIRTSS
jgi:hypothetical protein